MIEDVINIRNLKNLTFKQDVIIVNNESLLFHQENSGQRQMEYFLGNKLVPQSSLESFQYNIRQNKRLSEKYNFKYCHLITQSKEVAHGDKFYAATGKKLISLVDPFLTSDEVICPKLEVDDFYKGDLHNNNSGALKQILATIEVFGLSEFIPKLNINMVVHNRVGDLDTKLQTRSKESFISGINDTLEGVCMCNLRPYLNGNTGDFSYYRNYRPFLNKRIVIFGDSFNAYHLNIYSCFFSEVIYFRCHFVIEEIVAQLKPDLVITSNTERYLINVKQGNSKASFFFELLNPKVLEKQIDEYSYEFMKKLFYGDTSSFYEETNQLFIEYTCNSDSNVLEEINNIQSALSRYHERNGKFPESNGFDGIGSQWGVSTTNYILGLVPEYIESLPQNYNGKEGMYLYWSDGNEYKFILNRIDTRVFKLISPVLVDPRRPNSAIGIWSSDSVRQK